jgi:hypothetical protein
MPLHCRHCSREFELKEAATAASFSWPQLQAFWFVCPSCRKGNHVRVEDGSFAVIDIVGAPGPEWEYVERLRHRGVSFRSDASAFHIFLESECFSVEARK